MENCERHIAGPPGSAIQKTADIKSLALSHGPEALRVLVTLLDSKDEKVALAAAREILSRAAGKAEGASEEESNGIVVIREKNVEYSPAD